MCDQLIILGYCNADKHLAMCEHGMIHLTWYQATLYFRHPGLLELNQFLTEALPQVQPLQFYRKHHYLLGLDDKGNFQLWVGTMGLWLTSHDLKQLQDMVKTAITQLKPTSGAKSSSQAPPSLTHWLN